MACVLAIGAADYATGTELSFSLFYLIPIVFVTWLLGRGYGFAVSLASAVAWWAADVLSGHAYSQPAIRYWNAAIRLGYFLSITLLLPMLRELGHERELARKDFLTGAANPLRLHELLEEELERARRYRRPLSIAFLDLDGFKAVNDRWGHKAGDAVLRELVRQSRRFLRKTDRIARIGGDEFILLLPETGPAGARGLLPRIRESFCARMRARGWNVTVSIGAVTCRDGGANAEELIRRSESLMYKVKNGGKDGIAYSDLAPGDEAAATGGPPP